MAHFSPLGEKACREAVKKRADGLCERCGSGAPTTMHHRKKRSQGGLWTPVNIVAVCGHGTAGCHGWIEHNPNAAAEEGFHVRPWQIPEDTPIYQGFLGRWIRLTVDPINYYEEINLQDPWFTTKEEI